MLLPKTISARLSDTVTRHVPDVFQATLDDALSELFQNARRAGASHLSVTYRPAGRSAATVSVTDDGEGIANPAVLLAYGQSAWSAPNVASERPTGIGFASLATFTPTVHSKARDTLGFLLELSREHFLGEKPAEIMPTRKTPEPSGTTVTLATGKPSAHVEAIVRSLALHFPLDVSLTYEAPGGAATEHLPRVPFLDGTLGLGWRREGFVIGVSRYHPDDAYRFPRDNRPGIHGPDLNLHGRTLKAGLPCIEETNGRCWKATAQATAGTSLELVLPDRNVPVQNEQLSRLKNACYRAIYSPMQEQNSLQPVALTWPDWQRASAMGFKLPAPKPMLRPWIPDPLYQAEAGPGWRPVTVGAYLVEPAYELPAPLAQSLAQALAQDNGTMDTYQPQDGYEACPWYGSIPKIRAIHPIVVVDGFEKIFSRTLFDKLTQDTSAPVARVDKCLLELRLEMPGGKTQFKRLDTDVILLEDRAVAVSTGNTLTVPALADRIARAYCRADGSGQLGDETRRHAHERAVHDAAFILEEKDEADRLRAEHVLREALPSLFASGRKVALTIEDGNLSLESHTREHTGEQRAGTPSTD